MKNIILLFLFIMITSGLYAAYCECGNFSSGIYAYTVSSSNCCDTTSPSEFGFMREYEDQGGVWVLVGNTRISGADAQAACC